MGREFLDLFDEWAESYDDAVMGNLEEYKEVFEKYEEILAKVVEKSNGKVIEFGVGTGNLTKNLIEKGLTVYGIEPSKTMRELTQAKLPNANITDGDFLQIPSWIDKADTIVSTYAFHHLTDAEKETAIKLYQQILSDNGKVIFADTVFENYEAKEQIIKKAENDGYTNLLKDLKTEYYTTIPILREIFINNGFLVQFSRLNQYVWLIEAKKV